MKAFASDKNYAGERFRSIDVAGGKFSKVEFEGCTFDACVFTEASFSHCRFLKCKFRACDLSVVKLPNSRLVDCEFLDCKLAGVDWTLASSTKVDTMLFSVTFHRCVLDYGVFHKMPLKRLSECSAKETDFSEAQMSEADCTHSDFEGATFDRTDLTGANLVGAKNYAIDPLSCKVKKARFSFPDVTALLKTFDIKIEY